MCPIGPCLSGYDTTISRSGPSRDGLLRGPRGDKGGVPPVTVCGGRPRGPRQGVFAAGRDVPPAFPLGVRGGFARAAFPAPGAPLGHGAKG